MATSCAPHHSATWQALIIFISVIAVRAADAGDQGQCPPFSCGDLHNISYPFRTPGDPPEYGVQTYELICSSSKAIVRINTGTYFVTSINYTTSSFWVVDANLDRRSSCSLPLWDQLPYSASGPGWVDSGSVHRQDFKTSYIWACFINCSRAIKNNRWYKPVTCLSANNSFVYALTNSHCQLKYLEPSCGYLAMMPLGDRRDSYMVYRQLQNGSYKDIMELVKKGFSVDFPWEYYSMNDSWIFKTCLNNSSRLVWN